MVWLALSCFLTAYTHERSAAGKQHSPYLKVLESYTQKTLAGRRESAPVTNTHFIIIWKGKKYPENFFWRGANGLQTCNAVKVHKAINRPPGFPEGMDYTTENITAGMIHKGDTLQLTPLPGGKSPIPKEIPDKPVNTLFFKTGGSKWIAYPIKNITRKHDISMP